jgi:hypothetical protein
MSGSSLSNSTSHILQKGNVMHLRAVYLVAMFPLSLLNFSVFVCSLEPTKGDCSHGLMNTMCLFTKS